MRSALLPWIAAGLLCAGLVYAQPPQPPAGAPAGTTGLCNDGTYYFGATKRGACHGHKGVKEWWGRLASTAPAAPAQGARTATAPAAAATAAPPAQSRTERVARSSGAAAPGGGPGLVWVNHKSKVYHCPGDRWYGRTKDGEYMAEGDAAAKGYRPDHGKACK